MKKYIVHWLVIILFSLCVWIFVASLFMKEVWASYDSLDEKIERFCYRNELAKDYEFWEFWKNNWYRCTRILQSIYRFETWNLRSYVWNNIFNFRSPTCKKEWIEKYWCWIKNWFLTFPTKTDWIKFAVDRYYRVDYRKTIGQIISWGCYYNLNWVYVCFNWFTFTSSHWENYIDYVKKYFNKK